MHSPRRILIAAIASVAIFNLLPVPEAYAAESAPNRRVPDRRAPVERTPPAQRGPLAFAGTTYEGKNASGAVIVMEFIDPVRVHVTVGGESGETFDGFYFPRPNAVMVKMGSEDVVWTVRDDTLEAKLEGDTVTRLIKKVVSKESDPTVVDAVVGTKYVAQSANGRTVTLEFIDRQKARLTMIVRNPLEGTYRATAGQIVLTISGAVTTLTRNGDALDGKLFGATPAHFVKE